MEDCWEEENHHLWRDTQRQIDELAVHINDLTIKVADTNDAIARLAEESHAADRQLGEPIEALVSAMGKFPAK